MHSPRTSKIASVLAFTLAEVMMATVVVLVAVVGLVQAVTIGSEMLDIARKQSTAMLMIRNEIDGVHLKDWTTVTTGFASSTPVTHTLYINSTGTGLTVPATTASAMQAFALTNFTSSTADDNVMLMAKAKGFTFALTITTVKSNLLKFTYTVTWIGGNRQMTYNRSGTTYYGKYGLNLYYTR